MNTQINNILSIKQIIEDVKLLSESEQQILNTTNYQLMLQAYQNYFNQLETEVEKVEYDSCLVNFDALNTLINLTYSFAFAGLGVMLIKGKRKDENE